MSQVDPKIFEDNRRRRVDFWKDHIRRGGTPPFSDSPDWRQAQSEYPSGQIADVLGSLTQPFKRKRNTSSIMMDALLKNIIQGR